MGSDSGFENNNLDLNNNAKLCNLARNLQKSENVITDLSAICQRFSGHSIIKEHAFRKAGYILAGGAMFWQDFFTTVKKE